MRHDKAGRPVRHWQGTAHLHWGDADIEEVARHLDDHFYKLPQPGRQQGLGHREGSPRLALWCQVLAERLCPPVPPLMATEGHQGPLPPAAASCR